MPASVLAVLRSLPAPPAPVVDGSRSRYARETVRRALGGAARSLDFSPERRHGFLRALGEFEAHLLERDARVADIHRQVRDAHMAASPAAVSPPAARRPRSVTPLAGALRPLSGWGCLLSFAVLLAFRREALLAAPPRLEAWLVLLSGWLLYFGWNAAVRAALALVGRAAPRSLASRFAVPLAFAIVVLGHAVTLVTGFDLVVGAAGAASAGVARTY